MGLTGVATSSRSASHEVGHYLSLRHKQKDGWNLMCQTKYATAPTATAVGFFESQRDDVYDHCMVR